MLPLREAAATTGEARADGSKRPLAVGAGVGAAGFHQKYAPPLTTAARTITAKVQGQRRRTGVLAGTGSDGKFGSGAGVWPDVIGSFAGNSFVIVPDYR